MEKGMTLLDIHLSLTSLLSASHAPAPLLAGQFSCLCLESSQSLSLSCVITGAARRN